MDLGPNTGICSISKGDIHVLLSVFSIKRSNNRSVSVTQQCNVVQRSKRQDSPLLFPLLVFYFFYFEAI
jgi:hypothetical protein